MTKRKRSLLMSVMTLMLCLALVAGGTYALFTDAVRLTTHLQAGELDITLKRISLESKVLADDGFLDTKFSEEVVNFTNPTTRNVFDITDETLVVPMCYYIATMQIENHSDVAFGYWIEIDLGSRDAEFAKQLEVVVQASNGDKIVQRLSIEEKMLGSETKPVAILPIGGSDIFKITVTFVDDRDDKSIVNNDAMNQNVYFDVIVHAVQVTDRPQSN